MNNTTTPEQQPDTWVAPTSPMDAVADEPTAPAPGSNGPAGKERPKWMVPAIAALAGGLVVGAIVGIYAEGKMQDWQEHSAAIAAQRDEARGRLDALQASVGTITAERDAARAASEDAESRASAAEAILTQKVAEIEQREAKVAEREKAVSATEQRIADTTITEGTWTVGRDIEAGTYVTQGTVSGSCYWEITRSGTNGGDIIENDIVGGGRPTVTLTVGQDFTTNRCGSWVKQD